MIVAVEGMSRLGIPFFCLRAQYPGGLLRFPLPIDHEWKRDYATSIQRLIRDGIDTPLADLFVHATRSFGDEATGEERARLGQRKILVQKTGIPARAGGQILFECQAWDSV